jgi:alkylhydroperoxidase family enzyme
MPRRSRMSWPGTRRAPSERRPALLHNLSSHAHREFSESSHTFEISDKLRELAICRVAIVTRSPYEWHQHAPIAMAAGYTQEQLEALSQPDTPKGFDALEDLVIRLADTMSRDIQVSQDLFDALMKHFNEKQMVELVAIVASYNYLSRFLEAFEIQVES